MSTPERLEAPGSPVDKILAKGITEGRPVERAIAMEFPNLNSHPRIRHDGVGKLFIFSDNSPAGNRGWVEFDNVESALHAKPVIMDRHDRDNVDFGIRMDRTVNSVSSVKRQLREHVLEKDALILDGVVTKIIVDGRFTDVSKDERAKALGQFLPEIGKVSLKDIDNTGQFTQVWESAKDIVYKVAESMAGQRQIGVVEALGIERSVERFMLEQAADYARYVSKLGPGQKRPGGDVPLRDAINSFDRFFREDMSDQKIKLSPYSDVAVWARYLVLGRINSGISKETLTNYFGEKEAANLLLSGGQLRHYTTSWSHKKREEIVSSIRSVLDQGDANLLVAST